MAVDSAVRACLQLCTTSEDLVNDGNDLHTTLNTYLQYISLFLVYNSFFLIPRAFRRL